jgi:thiosulfate reductase cytochrome b subunit
MSNTVTTLAILAYDLFLVAGTAYLVQVHDWSMWTFLLTALFFITTTKKSNS